MGFNINAYPEYFWTGGKQVRVWKTGPDINVLVIPGLLKGARVRAEAMAAAGHKNIGVIDLMRYSSPIKSDSNFYELVSFIRELIYEMGSVKALVTYDLSIPLGYEIQRINDTLSLVFDKSDYWTNIILSERGVDSLPLDQEGLIIKENGTHMLSLWSMLRSYSLMDCGGKFARRQGEEYLNEQELNKAFLEFGEDPELYISLWNILKGKFNNELFNNKALFTGDINLFLNDIKENNGLMYITNKGGSCASNEIEAYSDFKGWFEYVNTNYGYFHSYRVGRKGKPIILLQSAPGSAKPLYSFADELGHFFKVFCPDFLGNGESSKPIRAVTINRLAKEMLDYADNCNLDKFDLWGTHTGAKVAIEMAHLAPSRVGKLILDGLSLMSGEMRSDVLRNYLPDLQMDQWGGHLYQAWNMRRDMFLFWPWYKQDKNSVRSVMLPTKNVLHDWTIGLLQSGSTYALSYRAAFKYDATIPLKNIKHPFLLTAGPDDMFEKDLMKAKLINSNGVIEKSEATVWYPLQGKNEVKRTVQFFLDFLLQE